MIVTALLIVALVLGAIDVLRSRGSSLTSDAVTLIAAILLYERLG